jgi:hypothetical protein
MDDIDLLKAFRDDMPEPTTDAWLRARAAIAAARAESDPPRKDKKWFRPRYALTLGIVAAASAVAGALFSQAPPPAQNTVTSTPPPVSAPSPLGAKVLDAIDSNTDIVEIQSTTQTLDGEIDTRYSWDYPWTGQPGTTVQELSVDQVNGVETSKWSLSYTVPPRDQLSAGNDNQCDLPAPSGKTVNYMDDTWEKAPPPCTTLPPGLELQVPTLHVIGHPVLNHIKTTELASATSDGGMFIVWVGEHFLPLQSQTTENGWTETEQYSYLVPTARNLEFLQLAVPTGFNEVRAFRSPPPW